MITIIVLLVCAVVTKSEDESRRRDQSPTRVLPEVVHRTATEVHYQRTLRRPVFQPREPMQAIESEIPCGFQIRAQLPLGAAVERSQRRFSGPTKLSSRRIQEVLHDLGAEWLNVLQTFQAIAAAVDCVNGSPPLRTEALTMASISEPSSTSFSSNFSATLWSTRRFVVKRSLARW